jgi:ankyrin repeat protein
MMTIAVFGILASLTYVQKTPSLEEKLVEAVRRNDLTTAGKLLSKGARASHISLDGTPVLLEAFRATTSYNAKGSIEPMVRLLLAHGAKADAIDAFGWCALTLADEKVTIGLVKQLLDRGADPNRVAMHGDPAICQFAEFGRADVVKLLLDRGARVDAEGHYSQTALGKAANQATLELITLLLSRGANPRYRGWNKSTVLHFAANAERSNVEILDYLFELGLEVNVRDDQGLTPLHWAAMFGHEDNLKWLLGHGADPKLKSEKGKTALNLAMESQIDRSRAIELLRGAP